MWRRAINCSSSPAGASIPSKGQIIVTVAVSSVSSSSRRSGRSRCAATTMWGSMRCRSKGARICGRSRSSCSARGRGSGRISRGVSTSRCRLLRRALARRRLYSRSTTHLPRRCEALLPRPETQAGFRSGAAACSTWQCCSVPWRCCPPCCFSRMRWRSARASIR